MAHAAQLSELFEPSALAPGLYVVASNAPAYGLARALADERLVRYVGERYTMPSIKEMLFEVPEGAKGRKPNPDVKVLLDSFANATDAYDDWKIKWWREAIQNGVDAGATVIRCEAHEQSDGTWLCSCEDNGSGMTRDTIENKLMAVGGTGKRMGGGDTVGGFGLAKNMLLFTWLDWEIHSRDSVIRGSGGRGSDFEPAPMIQGTKITVRMPPDKHTDEVLARAYIHLCDLPHVRFFVNGGLERAALRGKKLIKDEPEFQLWHNMGDEKTNAILVRARGTAFDGNLFLFEIKLDLEIGGMVIVDLLLPTIKILTDNRDGFNDRDGYYPKAKLMKFVKELTIEGKAALRAQKTLISQAFRGDGKFRAEARNREAEATATVGPTTGSAKTIADRLADYVGKSYGEEEAEVSPGGLGLLLGLRSQLRSDGGFAMPMASPEATRVMLQQVAGPSRVEAAIRQVVWRPDFYLRNEVAGYKVPKEFMPATMTPRAVKLLSVWTDLCRFVMMQLGSTKSFGVGYLFSTTAGAECLTSEGEQWLILNPFRDVQHQRMMLRPSADADLQWLYASAIHEVTHLADGIDYHGVDFAYALTRNMATCAKGWRVVKKIERATKLGVVAKVGAGTGEPVSASRKGRKAQFALALEAWRGGPWGSVSSYEIEDKLAAQGVALTEAREIVAQARRTFLKHRNALVTWYRQQLEAGTWPSNVRAMLQNPGNYADPKLPALHAAVFGKRIPSGDEVYDLQADARL